MVEQIVRGD